LACLVSFFVTLAGAADVNITNLRCEYRENPLGIDAAAPRRSWQLASAERGQRQTAYRVRVASSLDALQRGAADLWDSGRVESADRFHVRYAGRPLAARQAAHWSVQVWGQDSQPSAWSAPAHWELGLPSAADWSEAKWIRLAYYVPHDIAKLLRPGRNAIGLWLGNGFFGQTLAFGGKLGYGAPGAIAKLVIDYADGSQQVLVTGASWRATTGPILFDNV
jgi:hypothetical protein